MKVLLLGAGASKGAGYPLTSELLAEVGTLAENSASAQFREAWQAWSAFRDEVKGPLELVVTNPNPEVVFSLPDLLSVARLSQDEGRRRDAIGQVTDPIDERARELSEYYESEPRQALDGFEKARRRLSYALQWYFWFKHNDDRDRRSQRTYLRDMFKSLVAGDTIITLNWDSLAERTLAELKMWSPVDGYGFDRPLMLRGALGRNLPLPADMLRPSTVRVLKLHGSFGWCPKDDSVYLERVRLLQGFDFHSGKDPVELVDSQEPPLEGLDPMLVAHPSFLKDLSHPVIESLWREASERLCSAHRVEVSGYSLPPSDGAMRALLHPIASRCRRGEAEVFVRDPCEATRDRWGQLLGPNAIFDPTPLGD